MDLREKLWTSSTKKSQCLTIMKVHIKGRELRRFNNMRDFMESIRTYKRKTSMLATKERKHLKRFKLTTTLLINSLKQPSKIREV